MNNQAKRLKTVSWKPTTTTSHFSSKTWNSNFYLDTERSSTI